MRSHPKSWSSRKFCSNNKKCCLNLDQVLLSKATTTFPFWVSTFRILTITLTPGLMVPGIPLQSATAPTPCITTSLYEPVLIAGTTRFSDDLCLHRWELRERTAANCCGEATRGPFVAPPEFRRTLKADVTVLPIFFAILVGNW